MLKIINEIRILLIVFFIVFCSVANAEIILRYAFFAPLGTFPGVQMKHWSEQVKKRTDGEVVIKMYPNGTLLSANDTWDGVLNGVADIGLSSPTYDPSRFPLTSGMALPFHFSSATEASEILWKVTSKFKPKEFEEFKLLGMFSSEAGYIMTKKPIKNSEDIKGLKLRAIGGAVSQLSIIGASPVGMAMPEVPSALQKGTIDGAMTSRDILTDFGLSEFLKYYTDYKFGASTFAVVMNKNKWNSLPDNVKEIFNELSDEMPTWTGNYQDKVAVYDAVSKSKKYNGLKKIDVSNETKVTWDKKMDDLIDSWIRDNEGNLPARDYVNEIISLMK